MTYISHSSGSLNHILKTIFQIDKRYTKDKGSHDLKADLIIYCRQVSHTIYDPAILSYLANYMIDEHHTLIKISSTCCYD